MGTTVASDIYTIGRTLVVLMHRVPRLPEQLRGAPATGRGHPAVRRVRLALPADRQGVRHLTRRTASHRSTSCGSSCSVCCARWSRQDPRHLAHLRRVGALRAAGHHQRGAGVGRAAGPTSGHQRPAVRLAEQHLAGGSQRTPGRAAAGSGAECGGAAGPGAGRVGTAAGRPGQPDREPDADRRPVGVAGRLGERPCGAGQRGLHLGTGQLQRGLRAGARRARAQAGPRPGLRARWRG